MKFSEIIKKIHFVERFRELCIEFSNIDYTRSRPKKDLILPILKKIGYESKYTNQDRVYINKSSFGSHSLEYYFEIDGCGCDIYLYIRKLSTDWFFRQGFTGLLLSSNLYPPSKEDEVEGYMLFTPSIESIECALIKIKPILDDLKNNITPCLINNTIEFDMD
jgi:hypothetical protein